MNNTARHILPGHSFQHGPVIPLPTHSGDLFAHVWVKGLLLGCLALAHTPRFRGRVPVQRGAREQARAEGYSNVSHQRRTEASKQQQNLH